MNRLNTENQEKTMNIFKKRGKDPNVSSVVELLDQKTRLLTSKFEHARGKKHTHYFSKREYITNGIDPLCKICGLPLSRLTLERRLENIHAEIKKHPCNKKFTLSPSISARLN